MGEPIDLIRGKKRTTVFSEVHASPLEADGWKRVSNLTPAQLAKLEEQDDTQELPPVETDAPANEAPAPDQDAPAAGGIVPQNDVPQATNQGRLAKRGGRKG